MVKIKVCGITNIEDALLAVELGVDALGFIFAPSPRQLTPQKARRIIQSLPPFVERVGVFVNETSRRVKEIAGFCYLSALQFHGEESPSYCASFPYKVIKSFPAKDRIPHNILNYKVDAYLLDTYCRGKRGGSGRTFNWDIAKKVGQLSSRLVLSGGLNPENVGEAIGKVRPYAVDVASGVEEKPGKKSRKKMQKFVQVVRKNDKVPQIT